MQNQFSEIEACSPRSCASQAGDFFLLLEAEMAQSAQRFKSELERIQRGHQESAQISKIFDELNQAKDRVKELETVLATALEERDHLEVMVTHLSEENKNLRDELQMQKEETAKVQLEDKYRRALVYIDALQSKLSTSVPLKGRGLSQGLDQKPLNMR